MIITCCFIHLALSAQDDLNRVYSIRFSGDKTTLSNNARSTLDSVARFLKVQPDWSFMIGYKMACGKNAKKNGLVWDRVEHIINHLVTKYGINEDRFRFGYELGNGHWTELELTPTNEKVTVIPPPHPNLRKKADELPCATNPATKHSTWILVHSPGRDLLS
jgi:hypothetical protein